MQTKLFAAIIAAGIFCVSPLSGAQTFPSKPIRLIVPSASGGALDITARPLAQKLSERLGQQVVVDNRPGAAGIIGAEIVAKAPPDGHTIIMVSNNFTTNPALYSKLPYDPLKDFAPLSQVALLPLALIVHPSVPAHSVKELIAYAKSRPGRVFFSSTGNGGPGHFAGEIFKLMTGIDIVHVPYKGAGPAVADLVAGQVQMTIGDLLTAGPQIKAGKLRALAVSSSKRVEAWPDLPTIAEAGVPGYEASGWLGMFAPGGTPPEVVGKLHSEIVRALQTPEIRDRITGSGGEPVGNTPEQFADTIRIEIAKWAKVAKEANIRIE